MRIIRLMIRLTLILVLFINSNASAVEIFLWAHDNDIEAADRVFNCIQTCDEAMAMTLDELDIEYTVSNQGLPQNLDDYDIIIIVLGFYGDC